MNFLQLLDQMIKAVHCFEGLTLWELDVQPFWERFFNFNPLQPVDSSMFVGSLPINIESKHEALGPSLARGKSEVSQLCAGAFARRSSLNSDRQGSLNAPTPNLGF